MGGNGVNVSVGRMDVGMDVSVGNAVGGTVVGVGVTVGVGVGRFRLMTMRFSA